ncbi:excinuclease ABC subunit UvrA [Saccharibacillus sp. CPCC 101409]|uniref:excinuclease ABC subunit UvrA n=1 Tax=Saccharibacillus sp. CPCC 101409 TaxID=3058041 RepID=UPI002670E7A3|nr:excinuclease ABC subunit UvrA [Saccharibacillus sp. CPCC 101409]MDO3408956.1 excinuclease ABC subunit UvrA [Saccharibacillus sp. CPCC 101409]
MSTNADKKTEPTKRERPERERFAYEPQSADGMIRVRGANEHNLKQVDVDIPRDSLVVFTGVSGSGKSSLAFGTLYAEAQRRYLESVAPYARRLIQQAGTPEVESIEGLPPAVGLQQQRSVPQERSTVGSLTAISNVLRMLYARAGDYPDGQSVLYAEDFSPNTPQGACPECQGLGRLYDATEASMVPDPSLSIRQKAIASWPGAWHGQNLRDILISLGYDVDKPWRELPQRDRDWILFTEEHPQAPIYPDLNYEEIQEAIRSKRRPDYMGNYTGARRQLLQTYAAADNPGRRKRLEPYLAVGPCPRCGGKRLKREALSVTFAGLDIADMFRLPAAALRDRLEDAVRRGRSARESGGDTRQSEKALVADRLVSDVTGRLERLIAIGVGHLSLDRSAPTLSSGELQRLRLATQLISKLFGVVYVLDEPSAGLHPADGEALLDSLAALRDSGNSVFVVEHNLDVMKRAEWLVDIGPEAGQRGGRVLYSGPPEGLANIEESVTRRYLFADGEPAPLRERREPTGSRLSVKGVTFNNLNGLDAEFPLGRLTAVTGVSGSGKSSLVSHALPLLLAPHLGALPEADDPADGGEEDRPAEIAGAVSGDLGSLRRIVRIDQKPIGRTPRSNLATYTGLFDHVRRLFAAVPLSRERGYGAGRFSFNVPAGRCPTCEGQGFVQVELMFMSSLYVPCADCGGTRYNAETLEVRWNGYTIADVLALTVEEAADVFAEQAAIRRPLSVLLDLGLGYLKLGQPATELSGGESQRIKLAAELQRAQRGQTLYLLDEPTNGLHPVDADRLLRHLDALVRAGHTVVMVEHNMRIAARADWVIDIGPGAAEQGGKLVAAGTPEEVAEAAESRTAPYLARYLA